MTDLQPVDTEQEPFYYNFKVQCTSCREVHPNWVSISRFVRSCMPVWPASICFEHEESSGLTFNYQEQNEQQGSRGDANFVWKCQNCKVCLWIPLRYYCQKLSKGSLDQI